MLFPSSKPSLERFVKRNYNTNISQDSQREQWHKWEPPREQREQREWCSCLSLPSSQRDCLRQSSAGLPAAISCSYLQPTPQKQNSQSIKLCFKLQKLPQLSQPSLHLHFTSTSSSLKYRPGLFSLEFLSVLKKPFPHFLCFFEFTF